MPGKGCGRGRHRKHTEITSRRQQRKFGHEYGERKAGRKGKMPGITKSELRSHLKESKDKKLPERSRGSRKKRG